MNLKSQFESSLPRDHQHLLHFIADVAGGLGYPIYMVGGSVRDLMLGRTVNDFDLTVEGDAGTLAELMLRRLGGKIVVHSKFGTARWAPTDSTFERLNIPILQPEKIPPFLDFVSTRSEIYPQPGALPEIKKSGIDDDLRRRDFTINAMAVRLDGFHFGELFDIVDGRTDLERGLIRVLHPRSFIDDPTRMFRALRYAERYGFAIESETLKLFDHDSKSILADLSGERLRHEFDLTFDEANRVAIFKRMKELGLLENVHPALQNVDHERLTLIQNKHQADFGKITVPDLLSFTQTLGWVLCLMNLSEKNIDGIAERLAFPVLLTKAVHQAASLHSALSSFKDWKPSQWTFYLDELTPLAAYAVWLATSVQPLREYLENWQNVRPYTSGDDLKNLGLAPGPKYKEILSSLRAAWLNEEIRSKEEEINLRNRLIAE